MTKATYEENSTHGWAQVELEDAPIFVVEPEIDGIKGHVLLTISGQGVRIEMPNLTPDECRKLARMFTFIAAHVEGKSRKAEADGE